MNLILLTIIALLLAILGYAHYAGLDPLEAMRALWAFARVHVKAWRKRPRSQDESD